MIDESALSYKRGDLVEFQLSLGGGPKKCRGLILNTAVLYGRAARQLWILDMDDATPQLEVAWTKRKHIVHEEDIIAHIPSSVIRSRLTLKVLQCDFLQRPAYGMTQALHFLRIRIFWCAPTVIISPWSIRHVDERNLSRCKLQR